MKANKTLAIIGLGNIGTAVAENLSRSARSFIVSGRQLDRVAKAAERWGPAAEVTDIDTAITRADLLLPAIPYAEITPFVRRHTAALAGKVIIDPSNPIALGADGQFRKIVGESESAGQLIAAQLPEGVAMVKAFGTLGAASLQGKAHAVPPYVLFYAGDCPEANAAVEQLISDCGFVPMRVGGIDESLRLEVFGALHEFGGAGKAVTEEEAAALL